MKKDFKLVDIRFMEDIIFLMTLKRILDLSTSQTPQTEGKVNV